MTSFEVMFTMSSCTIIIKTRGTRLLAICLSERLNHPRSIHFGSELIFYNFLFFLNLKKENLSRVNLIS